MASIYKAYLAKVGIELELDVREVGVWKAIAGGWPKTYKEAAFGDKIVAAIWEGGTMRPGAASNWAVLDDPVINERKAKLTSFENMQNRRS